MRKRLQKAPIAAILLLAVAAPVANSASAMGSDRSLATHSGFGTNWTVYHGNASGNGVENATTHLRPLRPAWKSTTLDGELFAEPLEYGGRVFAATENDTVYGLAADTGGILWSTHLGAPVPASDLPCGDISPDVGITGTPVIDPARHEIFVLADELVGGSSASHHLVGLDLYTGRVELDDAVNPPGTTGTAELQRPGLAIDSGRIIVAFGGNYGDCGNNRGAIASVPAAGGPPRYFVLDNVGSERQGAIWMGGAAPVIDHAGDIWFAVGNGSETAAPYDLSESVIELTASLRRKQFFAPTTWAQDNQNDKDLGSTAPAFVDGYVFQVGKAHIAYLLNPKHLGGIGGQVAQMPLCSDDPHGGVAVEGSTVFVACGNAVTAVRITKQAPYMSVLWATPTTPSGVSIDGPPIVADGLVWSLDAYGTLWGLAPATGSHVLSEQTNAGEPNHFPTPAVADGLLLMPTTNQVYAFEGPAGRPHPPMPIPS